MRTSVQCALALAVSFAGFAPAHALQINVTGLTGASLSAFNRAADQWESRIDDPVTVNITASFGSIGGAGSASFSLTGFSYSTVRNAMINDAIADSSTNDGIVSSLPTSITFNAASGTLTNPTVFMTRPNARALGFSTSGTDGAITFSNSLAFDFDNSNGVVGSQVDFESVAAHEIGHILGFADNVGGTSAYAMDLYRFNRISNNPSSISNFSTFSRELRTGQDTAFDIVSTELRFSGPDGFSPSHWFNQSAGNEIGTMDPQIITGTINPVNENDLLLLDVIGWSIVPVPEPSSFALAGAGAVGLLLIWRIRRRRGERNS